MRSCKHHVLFVVEDLVASRRLYTAALAPLGIEEMNPDPHCVGYGRQDFDDFAICQGSPVTTAATSRSTPTTGPRSTRSTTLAAGASARRARRLDPVLERYYGAFVNVLHGNNWRRCSTQPATDHGRTRTHLRPIAPIRRFPSPRPGRH